MVVNCKNTSIAHNENSTHTSIRIGSTKNRILSHKKLITPTLKSPSLNGFGRKTSSENCSVYRLNDEMRRFQSPIPDSHSNDGTGSTHQLREKY